MMALASLGPKGKAGLNGCAPKDLATDMDKIARFKTRSMHTELHNDNWIRNLHDIHNTTQMEECTLLLMALSSVAQSLKLMNANFWGKYQVFLLNQSGRPPQNQNVDSSAD
jgi:hypothetical protein